MPAGEVSFLLRFEVGSIAFTSLFIYSENQEKENDMLTVPTGGRPSRVGFLPADLAAAIHTAGPQSASSLSMNSGPAGEHPCGREREALHFAAYCTICSEVEIIYISY